MAGRAPTDNEHVVRFEAKFRDLVVAPGPYGAGRPCVSKAAELPTRWHWRHDADYCRV